MKYFKYIKSILIIILLLSVDELFSQTTATAVRGGNIATVTNGVIEGGTILFKEGRIIDIGTDVNIPRGTNIIDASDLYVYPGFIDCFTNLGLADIESLGKDDDEATSPLTPQLRVIDAFNSENPFIPLVTAQGITTILCAPGEGNLLTGQSALIDLNGNNIDDMLVKFPVGIHGYIGENPMIRYGGRNIKPMTRMGEAALLRQTLIETREYMNKFDDYQSKKDDENAIPPPKDLKYESLIPILKKDIPFIVSANRISDILTALRIADEFDIRIIINHGAEAYRIAEKLAQENIPVIIGPESSFMQKLETKNALFENAAILAKAGVRIAFQTGSIKNYTGLIDLVQKSVANGLSYDEAVRALTIYPAQIFEVQDVIGSLEKNKRANIAVFEGDPFKELSILRKVIINGEVVFEN
ncbi:MAG: amidohydrolase family protein [bacterium]|nr:amidohydrolase family protein [bacterium]